MEFSRKQIIACCILLLLITTACGISLNTNGDVSEAEQTLQAIYAQVTAEALAAEVEQAIPEAVVETTVEVGFIEPEHKMVPGNLGAQSQTKNEIDTSNLADRKFALGDSFDRGNYERPFTETEMVYQPETDLIKITISISNDFTYFEIEVFSGSLDGGFPSSSYGVEFDTDMDGRGDILLWAKGLDSEEWTVENVSVLSDSNNDVGGTNPVIPDGNRGDGYDEVLFSKDKMDDPDMAWQRMEASDKIHLAIKTSIVDASTFMWKVWADSGVADPAQFDYNDYYSESQAGSPTQNHEFYPVKKLNRMDSTCWIAYNFTPTGYEPGGCVIVIPALPVDSPKSPKSPNCREVCYYVGDRQICTTVCD